MTQTYRYIGSADHTRKQDGFPSRTLVRNAEDVRCFLKSSEGRFSDSHASLFVVTFIIDVNGDLWIADRHSEHVHCARGQDVLSAGEITFHLEKQTVNVISVTNQSTGYCPEPDSWPSVVTALGRTNIEHPPFWTQVFIFRRCESCGMTNIVKDGSFECGVCQSELAERYNF